VGAASLYAIGGSNGTALPYPSLGKVQVYNPSTNTWTTKASLPHVVGYGNNGAAVIDGLIYVAGGLSHAYSMRYLQVYNPKTNTWVDKAPLPLMGGGPDGGLSFGVSGAINGKLYVLGHFVDAEDEAPAFLRYDPATNTWAFLPTPPFAPFR